MLRRTAVLALALAGCAHVPDESLLARAEFDLDCGQSELEVVELDARTRGVRGCGRHGTYVLVCDQGVNQFGTYQHDCTWVMNAATDRPAAQKD